MRYKGVQAFWRGNVANLWKGSASVLTRILFFDRVKQFFVPKPRDTYSYSALLMRQTLSAAVASLLSLLFVYPFDLMHTRMASEMSHRGHARLYPKFRSAFTQGTYERGLRGLY